MKVQICDAIINIRGITQSVISQTPPRLHLTGISATLDSAASLFRVIGKLGHTSQNHTTICSVYKVTLLLFTYALHLRSF